MTALSVPLPRRAADGTEGMRFLLRLASLSALALFAALHWATFVVPHAGGELVAMAVTAVVAGLALPWIGLGAGRVVRVGSIVALLLAALALILLAAHAPARALRPDHWDVLATGVGDGLSSLPALRVPYRGTDAWTRTVILTGGGLVLLLAACLALLPRPRTFGAAVTLGLLYAIPVIEQRPAHPYLDGAAFAFLLGALLWSDRFVERDAPLAIGLGVLALIVAVIAAPRLDSSKPWVDYEALAESLQSGKSDQYRWNHSYGPLDWPRDGLEIARVRSRGDLYIKTVNLERFDGIEWRQADATLGGDVDTQYAPGRLNWWQTIHVTVKGLKSVPFLTAGSAQMVFHSTKPVRDATPGTFQAQAKPLRRGDSYDARVYVPKPSPNEMENASTDYPGFVMRDLSVTLPADPNTDYGPVDVDFAPWGSDRAAIAQGAHGFAQIDADAAMRSSPYRGTYAITQELRTASVNPYDYVQKVIAEVQRNARYTESPPPPGKLAPLEAFITRDHAGYCQYFAGATALMLRMGGVPARVASGFSPGVRSGEDHVLRDYDAHSWVEVYFPELGWVTFDPTPADSPARSQLTDVQHQQITAPGDTRRRRAAGDRLSDPLAGGAAASAGKDGGGPLGWLVPAAIVVLLGAGSAVLAVRRRARLAASGDAELEELRIALVRSGRAPTPDMTLRRLEVLLAGSDGALAYLQALRLARYGPGAAAPTAAQRRALRRELSAGLGLGGRLRSLWMLPPQPREVTDALRPRRRRAYTA